ncbi:MAG: hypothetical protein WAW96_08830, partial [Alphaproteobacteria bacterium]
GKFVFGPMQSRQLRMERIGEYSAGVSYPYPSVELRVEKAGSWYVFKYRAASSDPWAILDERYSVEPVTRVGLITRGWDNRAAPVMADYDYFGSTAKLTMGRCPRGEPSSVSRVASVAPATAGVNAC